LDAIKKRNEGMKGGGNGNGRNQIPSTLFFVLQFAEPRRFGMFGRSMRLERVLE
jgi:hypothetical protein